MKVTIDKDVLEKVLNVLATLPYAQVAPLMQEVHNNIVQNKERRDELDAADSGG